MDYSIILISLLLTTPVLFSYYRKYIRVNRETMDGEELMNRFLLRETILRNREYVRKANNRN